MHSLHKPSSALASKPVSPAPMRVQSSYPALVTLPSASSETPADNHLTRDDFQSFLTVIQAGRLARQLRIVKKLSDMQF